MHHQAPAHPLTPASLHAAIAAQAFGPRGMPGVDAGAAMLYTRGTASQYWGMINANTKGWIDLPSVPADVPYESAFFAFSDATTSGNKAVGLGNLSLLSVATSGLAVPAARKMVISRASLQVQNGIAAAADVDVIVVKSDGTEVVLGSIAAIATSADARFDADNIAIQVDGEDTVRVGWRVTAGGPLAASPHVATIRFAVSDL